MNNTSHINISIAKKLVFFGIIFFVILTLASCSIFSSKKPPEQTHFGRVIKKKIVMTGFAVPFPNQVVDVSDIAQGIPREMLSRLERSGSFLIRQSPNLLSYDLKQSTPSAQLVKQVAAENDAQFVIAGEVRNAGIRTDSKYWGLWETRKRHIEIEFSIYDGLSGAFLIRHHLVRPAEDDSHIGTDKPFGSAAFYATAYGKAIDALLEESVAWIRKDLSIYPMVAKVVQVSNEKMMFDAGATSNVMVGDVALVVTHLDQLPITGLMAFQSQPLQLGTPQASLGKLKVIQPQLLFSSGSIVEDRKVDDKIEPKNEPKSEPKIASKNELKNVAKNDQKTGQKIEQKAEQKTNNQPLVSTKNALVKVGDYVLFDPLFQ